MSLPILSIPQMREWEKATWATGRTEAEVIERVGRKVADCALNLTREGDPILILAGSGHNGDDARQAERHLTGRRAQLLNVKDPLTALDDLQRALAHSGQNPRPALIIDGIFGIGINRPLDEDWQALIQAINASGIPILAVDVPSGLNADTGEAQDGAIHADVTLTVGAPKKGLMLAPAWAHVGRLEVARDVGLVPCPAAEGWQWTCGEDFMGFPPRRAVASHKGSYGHAILFAGSSGYHGAAVLAARGALRAQPGLVTVVTPESVYTPVASQLQAAMVRSWTPNKDLPKTCTAILIGPGFAAEDLPESLKNEMRTLWKGAPVPVIVDASAIDWLSPGLVVSQAPRVITPHPGEAGRRLRLLGEEILKDRPATVLELSRRYSQCWVVLKGHQTLVGSAAGGLFFNSSGNPGLAQGGSGDVLAGFMLGLLAQPALQADPEKTIRYAVWQHGRAADRLQETRRNWTVEDLAAEL